MSKAVINTAMNMNIITITDMQTHQASASSLRLWQLISPALPVGAYAYSQGLEYAVNAEWVHDEQSASEWITGLAHHTLASLDIPVFARLYRAWEKQDEESVIYWNRFLLVSRESAEILAEDRHLGMALAKLLADLGIGDARNWRESANTSFVNMFALGAVCWNIPLQEAARGYLWAWCENQVAASIKLVPLGQTAGQRILSDLTEVIPGAVEAGMKLDDEEIGMLAPGLGIASALHETQYSRLFRS